MAAAEATGGVASPRIGPAVLDTLVVGAGQAGLAAGYHLKRAGLSFEILEARGEPGGSWPGYYDSLKLFSPARYSGLPGMPFPGSPDRYPARDEVVGYLRGYAEAFGLPVLAGKRVLRAERAAVGGFRLLTDDGGEYRARTLIAATGSFARPHQPRFPGQEAFRGKILHAAEYRNPIPFRGKRVVIVGGGNSAVQIAHELVEVAETTLATRSPIRIMPQLVFGRDLHFWLSVSGLDRLPLGRLFDVSEPGGVVDDGTYAAAMRSGRPDRRSVFSRFTESGVVWEDGREEPVDAVLLATGYGPNLGYMGPLGALRADGHPDQRAGVSRTVPGLYFVGLPFQTSFASATLRGVGSDAELVVARARRQVARSVMEPAGHPASATPARRVRAGGPSFGGKRCCGVTFP
ncbi:MAG TPA: NAD(P)/FAD-dependent oxidoreductase [Rubrobacter sp.]|nr:NAD(P)/FAD-dependent oxidoreductase [Rubrobacter sp.]